MTTEKTTKTTLDTDGKVLTTQIESIEKEDVKTTRVTHTDKDTGDTTQTVTTEPVKNKDPGPPVETHEDLVKRWTGRT